MTLLYGKAANGNYYPVQVDDQGQIIAVQSSGLPGNFSSVELTERLGKAGGKLDQYESGIWTPKLQYGSTPGVPVSDVQANYSVQAGKFTLVGTLLVVTLRMLFSVASAPQGGTIMVGGLTIPSLAGRDMAAGGAGIWAFLYKSIPPDPAVKVPTARGYLLAGGQIVIQMGFIGNSGEGSVVMRSDDLITSGGNLTMMYQTIVQAP